MTATQTRLNAGDLADLDRYLQTLAGPEPAARLLELRFRVRGGGMGRVFFAAHSALGAARFIRRLAARTDVYTGVALRTRRAGGRNAIHQAHLAYVEIDTPDGDAQLARLGKPPTMIVASGTPGHLHAYWRLHSPIGVHELEHVNRRLAHHLAGDPASTDAARILRPPGTLNHKHTPPAPVELLQFSPDRRYDLTELVEDLAESPENPPRQRSLRTRSAHRRANDPLLAIPASHYVRALVRQEPNRAGKIVCPFHDDHNPSLQLYEDASWYCFACAVGGTIYDFAARLWGYDTKGPAFRALHDRLALEFGLSARVPQSKRQCNFRAETSTT